MPRRASRSSSRRPQVAELEAEREEKRLDTSVRKPADAAAYEKQVQAEAERAARISIAEAQAREVELAAAAKAKQIEQIGNSEARITTATGIAEGEATRAKGEAEGASIRAKGLAEAEAIGKRAEALEKQSDAVIGQQIAEQLPEIVRAAAESFKYVDNLTVLNGAQGISEIIAQVIGQAGPALEMAQAALAKRGNGANDGEARGDAEGVKLALAVVAALAVGGAAWWSSRARRGLGGRRLAEACASPPELYGTPPAGYAYAQLDAQGQRELREDLNAEALGASDVRPAIRADSPDERVAALVAVSMEGKSGGIDRFCGRYGRQRHRGDPPRRRRTRRPLAGLRRQGRRGRRVQGLPHRDGPRRGRAVDRAGGGGGVRARLGRFIRQPADAGALDLGLGDRFADHPQKATSSRARPTGSS